MDDRTKGIGFGLGRGGEMEACEFEDGEAGFRAEKDASINPDVDFSYIDVKIQNVLGDVQKEFEGGIFTESLAAKYGGYGSFLPAYKRSPYILSQTRSVPKAPDRTIVPSPRGSSYKDTCNDLSNQMDASFSKNSTSVMNSNLGGSARVDASTNAITAKNHTKDHNVINKVGGDPIQKTLKIRIKVGPELISARNNAVIHGGPGLELSSSEIPEENGGALEEYCIANDSPKTILQAMSRFPIAEGHLLSPQPENLQSFIKAGGSLSKIQRGESLCPGKSFLKEFSHTQLTFPLKSSKSCGETNLKPFPENIQIEEGNKSKQNDYIMGKNVDIDTPERQELNFQASVGSLYLSSGTAQSKIMVRGADSNAQEEIHRGSKGTFDQQKESNRVLLNEKTYFSGAGERDAFNTKWSMEKDGFISLNDKVVSAKMKISSKVNLTRRDSVEKDMNPGKNASSHRSTPVINHQKESLDSLPQSSAKKEKRFHVRDVTTEHNPKRLKTRAEASHNYPEELQRQVGRPDLMVRPLIATNGIKNINTNTKKSTMKSLNSKSGTSSFEAPMETFMDGPTCDQPSCDGTVSILDHDLINNWACCDICEKWRLLPDGMNPNELPRKWECCMQFWLPAGLNSCSINEYKTTNFINLRYDASLPEGNANVDHPAPSTSSVTLHVNQMPLDAASQCDVDCSQGKRASYISLERPKQKFMSKGKNLQCCSDGVDIISGGEKDLEFMSVPRHLVNDTSNANSLGKKIRKIGDELLYNSVRESKGSNSSLNRTMKEHFQAGKKSKHVDAIDTRMSDKSLFSVKKRKVRELHDTQSTQETAIRSHHLGEKKAMIGEGHIGSNIRKENRDAPDKKPYQHQDSLNEPPGKRSCYSYKNKTSECELKKDKLKLSTAFSEQEKLHSSRNAGSTCYQAEIDSTEISRYLSDQGNAKIHFLDKDERNTKKKKCVVKGKAADLKQADTCLIKRSSEQAVLHFKTNMVECPTGDADDILPELDKLTKESEDKNVAQHGSSEHEKANELDRLCPMKKCQLSSAAFLALKEAKGLKHAADRMKNVEQELERMTIYFQAALKFLQAASLSEPSSVVDIKYEELNESLKIYTETAALCEFCAVEYDRKKEMAFSALAYKCVEVAYFKVSFLMSHFASKDHQELQKTIHAFWPGYSPSSSASDLDNLTHPGALEKTTYAKGVNSLQITGSHAIAPRHSLSRWLNYTQFSVSAHEASRKSQNALAVVSACLGNNGCDSIASLKDTLNFNFHNVEELLRHIRVSMEFFDQ